MEVISAAVSKIEVGPILM